ncbi:MAG: hypothetical protein PHI05_01615 [Bacilli bacterium]|nr:hypothetical protein [Bacilli bacterium]MDD4547425.1 hypothetical protein [Bacilli bacterium]
MKSKKIISILLFVIAIIVGFLIINNDKIKCGHYYENSSIISIVNMDVKSCDYYMNIKKGNVIKKLNPNDSHKFVVDFNIDLNTVLNISTNFKDVYYLELIDEKSAKALGIFEIRDNFLFVNQKYFKIINSTDLQSYLNKLFNQ